jgi:hypothetical protein
LSGTAARVNKDEEFGWQAKAPAPLSGDEERANLK